MRHLCVSVLLVNYLLWICFQFCLTFRFHLLGAWFGILFSQYISVFSLQLVRPGSCIFQLFRHLSKTSFLKINHKRLYVMLKRLIRESQENNLKLLTYCIKWLSIEKTLMRKSRPSCRKVIANCLLICF